jgi:hypothetical protein
MRSRILGGIFLLTLGCTKPVVTNADSGVVAPAPEMVFYDEQGERMYQS